MLVRPAVPPRRPACVCVSASDSGLMSVSGSLVKENTQRRLRAKVNENETPNPSHDRGTKVRKSGRPGAIWPPEWKLGMMS